MPDRDGYITGVPCWVDSSHADPERAAEFYSALFGWEIEDVMPSGSPGSYLIGRLHGGDVAAIAGQADDTAAPPAWSTYIWVEDADEAAARTWAAGGRVVTEPYDVPGAGRMAVLRDPDGAEFRVWQAKGHGGAGVVNEHGALVFNELSTRNLGAAASFYRAVFGWEPLDADDGAGGGMWRLPGYGDQLEAKEPELRARLAAAGAPDGFEDVVAAYVVLGPDAPDDAPGWNVTFSVDDADAAATRAAALGGAIVVAPYDAPWVRTTVIADPQGATFRATQLVPENKVLARGADPIARAA
jgi:predicted enzyme related to lactoylglutathione lyase